MDGPIHYTRQLLRWFVRPFVGQEPSFYRAVTACLLAAIIFWGINSLNKTYTADIALPLRWQFDTARYAAVRPLPASLPVTVEGQGWQLVRTRLGTPPAVLHPVPRPGTRYLPGTARHEAEAMLEDVEVKEWAGDTLRLTFDRVLTRRLPLALAPGPESRRYAATFAPRFVTFRGPATLVAALPNPYPLPVTDYPAPGEEATQTLTLPALPAAVRPSSRRVQVRLRAPSQK